MRNRELLAVITFILLMTGGSYLLIGGTGNSLSANDGNITDTQTTVLHNAENACLSALVFTRTEGFRHGSISDGITAFQSLGTARNWTVTNTESALDFNASNLSNFDVVIFLNTTGDVLDAPEQAAFESYIAGGGGFFGVHSATDTEYDWAWYGGLVGAYFDRHPSVQEANVIRENSTHPSTANVPATWTRTDEWYDFQSNPRPNVNVLLTVDESTYNGGEMGTDHPIAWYQDNYMGGRAIYTAMGHTNASYTEPEFLSHLQGAVEWAAGVSCDPPVAVDAPTSLNVDGDNTNQSATPTYTWSDPNTPNTPFYNVIVSDSDNAEVYNQWFESADVCTGDACSALHDGAPLANGDYTFTVQAYIDENSNATSESASFTVNVPDITPVQAPTDLNVDGDNANQGRLPTYTWSDPNTPNTPFYNVVVSDSDNAEVYNQWFESADVCTGDACSALHDDAPLANGDYTFTVQAYIDENSNATSESASFTVNVPDEISNITAEPNQGRPTVSWARAEFMDWFQIYIGEPDGLYFLGWFDGAEVCNGTSCSVIPPTNLPYLTGGYQVWIQGYSFENGFSEWVQGPNLTFNEDAADLPTNLGSPNPTATQPDLEWTTGANAIWFEVIVALPGNPWAVTNLGWFDVTQVGCDAPGETCTLSDERLNNTLPSGEYYLYVRAWGPGGFSTGGPYPTAPSWAEGTFTR